MNTISKISTAVAAMALVSACGGTATPVVVEPDPLNLAIASFSEGPTPVTYDPSAGTLSVNGSAVVMPTDTLSSVKGSVRTYRSGAPLHTSAIAQNGDVYAVVSTTNVGPDVTAFTYGRRGPTTLAQTGSASFSGDYAGYFVASASGAVTSLIDGDVSLTADLAANTISGDITNRRSLTISGVLSPTSGANDAVISGGTIAADGSFNAAVTGGEFTFNSGTGQYTSGTGSVDGAFGGIDGSSVAGVFSLPQTSPSSVEYTEVGSFFGNRN